MQNATIRSPAASTPPGSVKIRKNVLLKDHTTFKIGGPAKYFFEAKSKEDLIEAIRFAQSKGLPFFILGGGSNVLVSDEGYNGIAIKIKNQKLKIKNKNKKVPLIHTAKIIEAEAGVKLEDLVKLAARNSLTGLEWAAGIPGTVSGAIYGNTAAFEKSISDAVQEVEILKCNEVRPRYIRFKNEDCKFGYKDSIFKKNKNLIILSCLLELKTGNRKEIENKINYCLNYREKNHPLNFPSAGSVFKNPNNISAGELIEKCGLKGKTIGRAQISKKHANFIVNLGEAQVKDVLELIDLAKDAVKKKFGIELQEEIQLIGV